MILLPMFFIVKAVEGSIGSSFISDASSFSSPLFISSVIFLIIFFQWGHKNNLAAFEHLHAAQACGPEPGHG